MKPLPSLRKPLALVAALLLTAASLSAQKTPPVAPTSSSTDPEATAAATKPAPTRDPGFNAASLEPNESLFYLAASLNVCGYDADLDRSAPVRAEVRADMNQALAASPAAQDARDALCAYIRLHTLSDPGANLAQYTALGLYLTPPPELTSTVSELDMQPAAAGVINVLPLVRNFAEAIHLNAIWASHRQEYEALVAHLSPELRRMILDTKVYLRIPLADYSDRRFVVILEPMLSPAQTYALTTGPDYFIVASPLGQPLGEVRMDDIRHTFLHHEIEPLIYAKADAMDRLLPLLQAVRLAPIDFDYKSDIEALLTECLIKAIEARTFNPGIEMPKRPNSRERVDLERYAAAMAAYNKQAEVKRRALVDLDMRQGWIVTEYFYAELTHMEDNQVGIAEDMAPILYGMDFDSVRRRGLQINFIASSKSTITHAPRPIAGIALAQDKLNKRDFGGAEETAQQVLADPKGDHGGAHEVLGILAVMQRDPDTAIQHFQQTLQLSKDPRTIAWAHIYLGRLYDMQPDRDKALAEYNLALANRDGKPDTKAAADAGIAKPFAAPQRAQPQPADDAPLDPTGKAEKEAYRPDPAAK